jgi:hypothetical protein
VVFSPDDATLAVATDTGVGIAPLSTFGAELAITPVANVQRIAFSPDGQTVVALTGPPWSQVDCKTAAVSQVFAVSVAAPGSANMLPVQGLTGAATDLAYDRSGALVLATPCDGGTTGGALVGKGIFALGTYAGDLSGILGQLKLGPPAPDPGDPEILTQPSLIQVAVSTQAEPVQALLPVDRFPFEVLQDTVNGTPIDVPLEVQIPASSIVAYQIAASPDGTHLVFADKVHYDAVGLKVLDITSCLDPPACTMVVPFFSAQLDLHRDVYHVTEVDVKNGLIAFRKSVGLIDTPSGAGGCGITFTDCSQGPPCPPQPPQDCSDAQGFVANGVSVLLGSR